MARSLAGGTPVRVLPMHLWRSFWRLNVHYTYRSARRDGWPRSVALRKFAREIWRGLFWSPVR